jgi:phosphoglycerate dehydrogenase-like enzyme
MSVVVNKVGFLWKNAPVTQDLLARHIETIQNKFPGVTVVRALDEAELMEKAGDCEVFMTAGTYCPLEFLRSAENLKWVHATLAGVDKLVIPELQTRGIKLTSSKGFHGLTISEHVLGIMISFMRGFHLFRDYQRNREWRRIPRPDEILGKTVGIIGLGFIGREVARKCKLMGMRVVAASRTPMSNDSVERFYTMEHLNEMLQEVDFAIITAPSTPETYHLIGEKALGAMKSTAYLINVGRGNLVDEQSLIKTLKEGAIAGAGLDVFESEPLPAASELWDFPNVIITPHTSATSPYYMDRAVPVFMENLERFLQGKELLFEVDPGRGY